MNSLRHRSSGLASGLSLVCATVLLGGLFLAGCAGGLPIPGQTSSTLAVVTTTTTQSREALLAGQVAATWSEAMQKLVPLLEGMPPISSLQTPVAQLKEQYVQKMVALGRQIQALDPAQRQDTYDRLTDLLAGTASTDWFLSYVRLYNQYAAGADETSQDFAVLLSTFNTLTQYAFFDLLKAQAPDEAQRLGIN